MHPHYLVGAGCALVIFRLLPLKGARNAGSHRTRVLQDLAILKRIGSETRLRRNLGVPRAVFEACSSATPVGLQFFAHRF
jgi:hypothetical protein